MRRRHALYLSEAMTERLELMAETHRLSKSELLERALQAYLTQDADGRPSNLCGLQQEQNGKALKRIERDVAIATELLATFVAYFLTITPPLPARETEAARALGRLRFDDVIAGIAHRLKTDRHLIARVLDKLRESDQLTPTAGVSGVAAADAPVNRATPTTTMTETGTDGRSAWQHRAERRRPD